MAETPNLTLYKMRASTIKNLRKARRASPEVLREFKMTIPRASGMSQVASVRVFKSRMHTLEKCRFIIHCAFPLKTEAQAFSVLQLIKMQVEVRLANHHCQAYILKSGDYSTDDGISKIGAFIRTVMTEVRAIGVACVVSVFSFGSRKKFRIGRILSSVERLLQEAGREGFVIPKYKWGVGRSSGGISVPHCELRTARLSSINKRMRYSVLRDTLSVPINESIVLNPNSTKRVAPIKDPVICPSTSSKPDKFWPAGKRMKLLSSVHIKQESDNFTDVCSDPISRSVSSFHKHLASEVESFSSITSSCVLIETKEGSRSIRFLPVKRTMQDSLLRFKRMKR